MTSTIFSRSHGNFATACTACVTPASVDLDERPRADHHHYEHVSEDIRAWRQVRDGALLPPPNPVCPTIGKRSCQNRFWAYRQSFELRCNETQNERRTCGTEDNVQALARVVFRLDAAPHKRLDRNKCKVDTSLCSAQRKCKAEHGSLTFFLYGTSRYPGIAQTWTLVMTTPEPRIS